MPKLCRYFTAARAPCSDCSREGFGITLSMGFQAFVHGKAVGLKVRSDAIVLPLLGG